MKREALLDCFDTMKACYGRAWARTSVDLAIEVNSLCSGKATPTCRVCLATCKAYLSLLSVCQHIPHVHVDSVAVHCHVDAGLEHP